MQAIFCASSNLFSQTSLIQTPQVQTRMAEMNVCLTDVAVLKRKRFILCLEQLSTSRYTTLEHLQTRAAGIILKESSFSPEHFLSQLS